MPETTPPPTAPGSAPAAGPGTKQAGLAANQGAPAGFTGATGTPLEVDLGPDAVTINLDGRPVRAKRGEMLIAAAERAGTYIPRFCYHPRMKPVGMCRMCLVDVKGPRGFSLTPACYVPVAEGMEVVTDDEKVKKAQDGMLEFLLINHPLDCPVCDKGGECPLQDQTLAYGPGETRFVEEKRHWDKPVPLSSLVLIDRERCIQCARCTRFAEEVAGDAGIDFASRADSTEVAVFPGQPFVSNFSGNVVQICPVGALLAKPYRFKARPWDLEQVESTCTFCAVGCRVAVQSSSDQVVRFLGVDSDPVNWGWLCDKGRFGFEALNSPERLSSPLVRRPVATGNGTGGETEPALSEASWAEALGVVTDRLQGVDGRRAAVIGGARLPNEDAYAWAKFARVVLGTDNVDAQLGDGLPGDLVAALPRATIDETCDASLVVLVAPDIKQELPVLYLRLRHAAVEKGVPLIELSPVPTGLTTRASLSLRYQPGLLAEVAAAITGTGVVNADVAGVAAQQLERARQAITSAERPVVVLGRPSLAEPATGAVEAARSLAALPGVRFLPALRRSNVHGAIDMGLAPGLLPGRVSLSDGRTWYEKQWGTTLPREPGLDTLGILARAAAGQVDVLFLLGADPLSDCPDNDLARRALQGARFVVAIDAFLSPSTAYADVVLPAAVYSERRGSFTNIEGRVTWLGQKVTAPGTARPDWMIAVELASRLGGDLGVTSLEELWGEIQHLSPLHTDVPLALLVSRQGRNGVVVGSEGSAHMPQVPPPLDPMADPGIAQVEIHPAPPASLSVANPGVGRANAPGAGPEDVQEQGGAAAAGPGAPGEHLPGGPATLTGTTSPTGRPPMVTLASVRANAAVVPATGPGGPPPVPGPGTNVLRLATNRPMWDGGVLLQHSPSLAALHPGLVLRANPADLDALALATGAKVSVSSARGALVAEVQADAGVAPGTAVLPFNLPGAGAGALIDAVAPYTEVRVGPVVP